MAIWSTYGQRKQILDRFGLCLPDKAEKKRYVKILEERLGVCNNEVTQTMEFAEKGF